MLASVTRLSPKLGSISEAVDAFRAAWLQISLAELTGIDSPMASALRARVLLRTGDPQRALVAAAYGRVEGLRDRGELALLSAVAHARLGHVEETARAFADARVFSISACDTALETEVEYYLGVRDFGSGDLEQARAACLRALAIATNAVPRPPQRGLVPLAHVVSRTQELLGAIDAAEGRYYDQLGRARAALQTLDDCPIPDVFQEAFAVANLAQLARDFDLPDDATLVATRVETLAWTDALSRSKFRTLEPLGWCSALRGDNVAALGYFRAATETATTPPELIKTAVDRALVARELGFGPMVAEEIGYALKLAAAFDWENAVDDLRSVLLELAQVACAFAPSRARDVLDRYTKIRRRMEIAVGARLEDRVRAEEAYTHGVMLRAEGRIDESMDRLQTAFETWDRIDYTWRAGRAALELAELEAGDAFRLAVRRELRRRPDSIFAKRARLVA